MRSLRTRLLLVVLAALAPALACQVWIEVDATRVRERLVEDEALRLVRLVADQQQRIAEGAEQALYAIANAPSVQEHDAAGCHRMLAGLVAQVPRYSNAAVIGLDGHVLCVAVGSDLRVGVSDRSYFRLALETGGFVIGDYETGRFSGLPTLHVAQPYRDADGKVVGVVGVALSIDWLGRQLEQLGLPPETAVSVSDRNGIIVARFPESARYVGRPMTAAARKTLEGDHVGVTFLEGLDGRPRIVAYSPLGSPPMGLRIGVGLDREAAFAEVTGARRLGLLLIAAGAALGLLVTAVLGGRLLRRPVHALLVASHRWTEGDLSVRTGLRHDHSEFGRIAAGFDAMADSLQARDKDLRSTGCELRRLTADLETRVQREVAARAAAQLRAVRAERLQALGQLAAGIAHDFNNVLQSVASAAGLVGRRPGDEAAVRRWVHVATEASARGAAITRRLLAFGRRGDLSPQPIDVAAMLAELREMFVHTLGPAIEVVLLVPGPLPLLVADRGQLEIALVNLAANARDAMPGGGQLTLSATAVTGVDRPGAVSTPSPDDRYVRISVADTGSGMDAVTLGRAVEPFFTTKGPGQGTGLGLPMAKGFAEQSGGALELSSRAGDGTTVTLWLPVASEVADPAEPSPEEPAQRQGAGLRVLLVDDEALLREIMTEVLQDAQLRVCCAASGAEALAILDAGELIDVMVTDLSMPGMDGYALIGAVHERRPGLPAILLTGYAGEAPLPPNGGGGFVLLRKPISGHDLLARITDLASARVAS